MLLKHQNEYVWSKGLNNLVNGLYATTIQGKIFKKFVSLMYGSSALYFYRSPPRQAPVERKRRPPPHIPPARRPANHPRLRYVLVTITAILCVHAMERGRIRQLSLCYNINTFYAPASID